MFTTTTSGTSAYRLAYAVRIKRINVWSIAPAATTGGAGLGITTGSIEWVSEYGPNQIVGATSLGIATPSHFSSVPPKDSLAAMWSQSGSNESTVVVILVVNTSDVIDVEFELVCQDGQTPVDASTSASGTAGKLYARYLDGGSSFEPFGYVSII